MKKTIVGTGITQRVEHWTETPDEIAASLHEMSGRTFDFENLVLKEIEKTALKFLGKSKLTPEEVLSLPDSKKDSPQDYAGRWLQGIRMIRGLRECEPDLALRGAFELGQSFMKYGLKFKFERPALSGLKRAEDLRQRRDAYNEKRREKSAKKKDLWRRKALKIWSKHPTWGAPAVAKQIAKPKENSDYIRQIISPFRPPKK